MTDKELETKITNLQTAIEEWAIKNEVWTDAHFTNYQDEFGDEPGENPCVVVLISEGGIFNMMNGYSATELQSEFDDIVEKHGFYCEPYNHYIFCFYASDDEIANEYSSYFEWKWICELVKPNYTNLYQEIFEFFGKNGEKLKNLHWRKFEVLLSEIFRNQGYKTELGKGSGDGGVDVKIFRKEGIDEIVTLVQAKRYKEGLPVNLSAVQALSGVVHTYGFNDGIVATTSRFLPSAKKFSVRVNSKVTLAGPEEISEWCRQSGNFIQRDKSLTLSDKKLISLLNKNSDGSLEGKVVVASVGYNIVKEEFCLIVKDTQHVALLMKIPTIATYSDPPYNQRGYEVPNLSKAILSYKTNEHVFRARKMLDKDGRWQFVANKHVYIIWDNKPAYFDLID